MTGGGESALLSAPLHGPELDALFDGMFGHRSGRTQRPDFIRADIQRRDRPALRALSEGAVEQGYRCIALAVSGGADSMALMILAHDWNRRRHDPLALFILTVDHGLRAEAASEAAWVKAQAIRLGLRHETLRWTGAKPHSDIQAAARAARYDLMLAFCREAGIDTLVTAHNADDQAETMLMRLARGSGLDGVAGIPALSGRSGVILLRPLLSVSRARLEASLRERGESWIEDPSNRDASYERVRLRKAMREAGGLPLRPEKLALSASRMHRARLALEAITRDFLERALHVHPAGFGELSFAGLREQPEEIGLRAIGAMMEMFGGGARPVRLARIEALYAALGDAHGASAATTLGGCAFILRHAVLSVMREFGRMGAARLALPVEGSVIWDGRFTISAAGAQGLTVGPLGPRGCAELRAHRGRIALPARIAHTLPAIRQGENLVFVPCATFAERPPARWLTDIVAEFGRDPSQIMLP